MHLWLCKPSRRRLDLENALSSTLHKTQRFYGELYCTLSAHIDNHLNKVKKHGFFKKTNIHLFSKIAIALFVFSYDGYIIINFLITLKGSMRFACLSKEDKEELRKTAVNGKNSAEKRHW